MHFEEFERYVVSENKDREVGWWLVEPPHDEAARYRELLLDSTAQWVQRVAKECCFIYPYGEKITEHFQEFALHIIRGREVVPPFTNSEMPHIAIVSRSEAGRRPSASIVDTIPGIGLGLQAVRMPKRLSDIMLAWGLGLHYLNEEFSSNSTKKNAHKYHCLSEFITNYWDNKSHGSFIRRLDIICDDHEDVDDFRELLSELHYSDLEFLDGTCEGKNISQYVAGNVLSLYIYTILLRWAKRHNLSDENQVVMFQYLLEISRPSA